MKSSHHWLYRHIAVCLVLLLVIPAGEQTAVAQQAAPAQQPRSAPTPQAAGETQGAKDSAGATVSENSLPENPAPASAQSPDQTQPASTPPSPSAQQQSGPPKAVGTAAAPYGRTVGIAASRPAGAAIAPAKQKRVRTILISVGVIVGAAIAVGSVAALSHGSPSRP